MAEPPSRLTSTRSTAAMGMVFRLMEVPPMVGEPATRLPFNSTRVRSEPRPRRPTVDWDWKELPDAGETPPKEL
ncbi:hypothetical protein D3C84_303150 [compost metagenome]